MAKGTGSILEYGDILVIIHELSEYLHRDLAVSLKDRWVTLESQRP